MPAPSPEPVDVLGRLEKAVRQGDWNRVATLTSQVADDRCLLTPEALADRSRRLHSVLVAARIARSRLVANLSRARACAGFSSTRARR